MANKATKTFLIIGDQVLLYWHTMGITQNGNTTNGYRVSIGGKKIMKLVW